MLTKTIAIGDKVHIKDGENQYVSKVLDFFENGQIFIAMPIYQNVIVPLQEGFCSSFMFYTKRGIYIGKYEVVDRMKEDNMCYLMIVPRSELERLQRRQFYRLQCLIDILYHEEQKEEDAPILWKKAIIIDLSGGGARFNCNSCYEPGDLLYLQLELPVKGYSMKRILPVQVILSKPIIHRTNMFETHVEFFEISPRDRELVIKYVFEEERKIRCREKG